MQNKINWKLAGLLILITAIVILLWKTPVVFPIKIFVVLLHELSHGLASVITGGKIVKIELSMMQGGLCTTQGGWRILILPAGYIGSMLWGAIILLVASRSKWDKWISQLIGLILILLTLFFIRSLFGFIWGLLFGAGMIAVGFFAPMIVNDTLLKSLGLISILYAVIDIKDDLIDRTVQGSDAYEMSKIIPLPPIVWGILWMLIAVVLGLFCLKIAVSEKEY